MSSVARGSQRTFAYSSARVMVVFMPSILLQSEDLKFFNIVEAFQYTPHSSNNVLHMAIAI